MSLGYPIPTLRKPPRRPEDQTASTGVGAPAYSQLPIPVPGPIVAGPLAGQGGLSGGGSPFAANSAALAQQAQGLLGQAPPLPPSAQTTPLQQLGGFSGLLGLAGGAISGDPAVEAIGNAVARAHQNSVLGNLDASRQSALDRQKAHSDQIRDLLAISDLNAKQEQLRQNNAEYERRLAFEGRNPAERRLIDREDTLAAADAKAEAEKQFGSVKNLGVFNNQDGTALMIYEDPTAGPGPERFKTETLGNKMASVGQTDTYNTGQELVFIEKDASGKPLLDDKGEVIAKRFPLKDKEDEPDFDPAQVRLNYKDALNNAKVVTAMQTGSTIYTDDNGDIQINFRNPKTDTRILLENIESDIRGRIDTNLLPKGFEHAIDYYKTSLGSVGAEVGGAEGVDPNATPPPTPVPKQTGTNGLNPNTGQFEELPESATPAGTPRPSFNPVTGFGGNSLGQPSSPQPTATPTQQPSPTGSPRQAEPDSVESMTDGQVLDNLMDAANGIQEMIEEINGLSPEERRKTLKELTDRSNAEI
jgi:hypothetical protein